MWQISCSEQDPDDGNRWPVPSHGAYITGSCTNSGALRRNAQSGTATFETIRCAFLKIAVHIEEDPHRLRCPSLSARSSLDRARHLNRRPRSVSRCGKCRSRPQLQSPTRPNVPQHPPVNPADAPRLHRQAPAPPHCSISTKDRHRLIQDYPPRLDVPHSPRCLARAPIEQVLHVQRDRRGLEDLLQWDR